MPELLINFYNLRDGVDLEDYKKWSRTVDQPTCNSLDVCHKFEVYLTGEERSGKEFFDVIEYIEVDSYDGWRAATKAEGFAQVNEEWPLYGVEESVVSIRCEKI